MRFAVFALLLLAAAVVSAVDVQEKGVVFGVGQWSAPNVSQASMEDSLAALAETGATHVRLPITWYHHWAEMTDVSPNNTPDSPLRSFTVSQIEQLVTLIHEKHSFQVVLAPIVDIDWDNTSNTRINMSRADMGKGFTDAQWQRWFFFYASFVKDSISSAIGSGDSHRIFRVDLADGLTYALETQGRRWIDLVNSLRRTYPGIKFGVSHQLTDAQSVLPDWFQSVLDVVGLDVSHFSLAAAQNVTVEEISAAWLPYLDVFDRASQQYGSNVSIVISAVGFQSRPHCHRTPNATPLRANGVDCSAFPGCFNPTCQEVAYEATFNALRPILSSTRRHASSGFKLGGIYLSGWTADGSARGPSDSSFTPRGKPAEAVMRKEFGGKLQVAEEKKERMEMQFVKRGKRSAKEMRNGFVFGIGEWAGASMRVDGPEAAESLDLMISTTGANAVEFPITWFFVNKTDTTMFPITDATSQLRTPDDKELETLIIAAKQRGLRVCLSPMLDPTCQGFAYPEAVCYWRADMGTGFTEAEWALWFESYSKFILHYAEMAGKLQYNGQPAVDEFHVSHELVTAERDGPVHMWNDLVGKVRNVFKGEVAVALNWGPFVVQNLPPTPSVPLVPGWIAPLDHIGVDCYFPLSAVPVPALPWQTPDPATVKDQFAAAWKGYVEALSNYSIATGGKKIVCTEVGYQSRMGSWASPAGLPQLDGPDCSVWDQCISSSPQALAYDALLSALMPQEWYAGTYLWLWRADPLAGGRSNDDFTPAGKEESLEVLRKFWM